MTHFSERTDIAGVLPNSPDELTRWLMSPQSIKPGDVMPDVALSRPDALDIAAYLYTLR